MKRIVLAAGGTAGHVYPAIAVAEELQRRGVDVLFAGTADGLERELLRGHPLEILPGLPFQRRALAGRAVALLAVPASVLAARRLLRRGGAAAVVGFGGYASVGPVLAARTLGIPAAILEPNAVLGMANRFLARFADRIYIGAFTRCDAPAARRTGLPLRRQILDAAARTISTNGARVLLFDDALAPDGVKVLRPGDAPSIADAYRSCELVIARAGAGTLAEISLLGLPAIVVPLREAAEDHQWLNAEAYRERGAAIVASSVTAEMVLGLLDSPEERERLGRAAAALAAPNAARDLVDDLLELI
ncbi:MAG TPA: glycosyltransferase [Thermoanaerobaculia bacterium]|nr:glycosyltransferase [Thermoanaerobaculia bacterium]